MYAVVSRFLYDTVYLTHMPSGASDDVGSCTRKLQDGGTPDTSTPTRHKSYFSLQSH